MTPRNQSQLTTKKKKVTGTRQNHRWCGREERRASDGILAGTQKVQANLRGLEWAEREVEEGPGGRRKAANSAKSGSEGASRYLRCR